MDSGEATPHGLRLPGSGEERRPRTVLVLGGGGMRGMAHVGILRAMQTLGLEYDAIVGTSIGSLVGAMAAGGATVDEIEETVSKVQKENTFRLNFLKFLLKGMRTPSVYSGDTFRERLDELVKHRSFAELKVPFYCNAVRLEDGGSVFFGTPGFDEVPLLDALYASCCLPGVFEPWQHDGFHYMDGGITDAVPLRFAKSLQPDLIIAVDLTVKATFKAPNYKSRVLSTLYRSFEIAEEVLVENALHMHADQNTVLIQPKVGHLHRFDFDDVAGVIKMGEEEAYKVFTSHAATRGLVTQEVVDGLSCPVQPRDFVSIHLDPARCVGCGMCEMVCETEAFWAQGEKATVRKLSNYECTRDHACARNCPTDAISLGNL
ncbi:MAG: patatin-like phospholipase family protein [Planctomycetes bacterium]|nr:patatin-like phospholipase family protein [Planctomycetota bacterium]